MKFCSDCGSPVTVKVPEGDNLPRHICDSCNTIHYQNPKIVTGCIPEWEDRILLCKRAIEPRYGLWTLPAGFMENDETIQQAAMRETTEEANASVEITELYGLFNIPHINQVYMLFRASLLDLDFGPGDESLEVCLYTEDDIPWDDLAFPVITETLMRYFEDRGNHNFRLQTGDIAPMRK
ncbi:MAG: NUDIX hydrolase [Gammaproteobacteria bacterium]|nr:MAG: NUDIX hydrolase [Gammaproteobacteria bacterium]